MGPPEFLNRILYHMRESPGRNAFFIAGSMYTYGQLASLVTQIQQHVTQDANEQDHVGVYITDDIQTYASILAIWMSGKAFTPINPLFPTARNVNIMEQLELEVILHSRDLPGDLKIPGCRMLCTANLEYGSVSYPRVNHFDENRDAYVLFTSGSTGIPKGVRISFLNLNAFVRDFISYPAYSFSIEDRFLQIYDLSFDASVHCYTVPLSVGASVYTVPPDGIKYLAAYKLMREHALTFVKMPPSTLSYLRPHFKEINLPALKYCLLGGEAFPADLGREFESSIPNALIQNVYGPTEATINCLIYDWNTPGSRRKQLNGIASIGRGFGSNRVLVLSASGRLVRPGSTTRPGHAALPGEEGELLVAGEQVSPGYWNNPGLDQLAFVEMEEAGTMQRYYRTGDMVTVDEEGDVMFMGRNDEQVQVRGYRVELGEIESLARTYLGGANVMATGREQGTGEMKIILVIETEDPDTSLLSAYLEGNLPSYMIPEKIITAPHFPRLVSGKLDRKAISKLLPE